MHRLGNYKPSVEAVEKVVNKFPSTLSYVDENGRIPIQTAAMSNSCSCFVYLPILAKEGVKHKLGGEDARGGLFMVDLYGVRGYNSLQLFSNVGEDKEDDAKRLDVLKELRNSGLLLQKDIEDQELLDLSCWKQSKKRFEYFANWDPDTLIDTRVENNHWHMLL